MKWIIVVAALLCASCVAEGDKCDGSDMQTLCEDLVSAGLDRYKACDLDPEMAGLGGTADKDIVAWCGDQDWTACEGCSPSDSETACLKTMTATPCSDLENYSLLFGLFVYMSAGSEECGELELNCEE